MRFTATFLSVFRELASFLLPLLSDISFSSDIDDSKICRDFPYALGLLKEKDIIHEEAILF